MTILLYGIECQISAAVISGKIFILFLISLNPFSHKSSANFISVTQELIL
jgi:hypothetical protein